MIAMVIMELFTHTLIPQWDFHTVSDQCGWEHVSVTAIVRKNTYPRTPTWSEMCKVKDLFWDEEDVVVQFHPRKSEYVDNHKYCLHLWRKSGVDIETPPVELV